MDISLFRLLVRYLALVFLIASILTKEWFYLMKTKQSILIKIGIFGYCNDEECFLYKENHSIFILKNRFYILANFIDNYSSIFAYLYFQLKISNFKNNFYKNYIKNVQYFYL